MRPRFMNRGSPVPVHALDLRTTGFNEAPIHESGKYRPAARGIGGAYALQ